MTALRVFWFRVRGLFGRARRERQLDNELAFHFDWEVDRMVRQGSA